MRAGTSIAGFLLLTLLGSGCVRTRMLPPDQPLGAEAHFIRVCESLAPEHSQRLKDQQTTLNALGSIRPQGRICFVCQQLTRCTNVLKAKHGSSRNTAREIASSSSSPAGQTELPPQGGPQLWEVQEYACTICADQPYRIRDTSLASD